MTANEPYSEERARTNYDDGGLSDNKPASLGLRPLCALLVSLDLATEAALPVTARDGSDNLILHQPCLGDSDGVE